MQRTTNATATSLSSTSFFSCQGGWNGADAVTSTSLLIPFFSKNGVQTSTNQRASQGPCIFLIAQSHNIFCVINKISIFCKPSSYFQKKRGCPFPLIILPPLPTKLQFSSPTTFPAPSPPPHTPFLLLPLTQSSPKNLFPATSPHFISPTSSNKFFSTINNTSVHPPLNYAPFHTQRTTTFSTLSSQSSSHPTPSFSNSSLCRLHE